MYENGLRSSRTYLPSPQFVYSSLVYCFHRGIYFPISLFEFIFVSKKKILFGNAYVTFEKKA